MMQEADTLIRTKLRLPFTRPELVPRPRLQARVMEGLRRPLTLVTAPAGFGKTTLVASCVAGCGMPVAWLSLDGDDNQGTRFLSYLIAALREADDTIGREAAQLVAAARPAPPEVILTSLINDLDAAGGERVLVLDDYQFMHSQGVHQAVGFMLEHCPRTCHLVIATRSDPPLPLTRLRARGHMVELRSADLGFSESEATEFLNGVMGLGLDAGSVSLLKKRTEGWIAGLQMAALSMRDHRDVAAFIEGFSGTNRYILDYLLEEVLANQPPEIQRFLLRTSILTRLSAPLCDVVLADTGGSGSAGDDRSARPEWRAASRSASILAYLEQANLFLVPLDDERIWYRYHHLFADLLRAQLHRSLDAQAVALLHVRAAEWHRQDGSILEAIHHASAAADEERVERLIEQHYMEMVRRGEMAGMRYWRGKLRREQVHRRPWLCIYEAYSHAWFGELDEADLLLDEAQKRIRSESRTPETLSMQGHLDYVRSRVTAMRGDIQRAIAFCLAARENIPADNLALQFDTRVTLGYEYFLHGDDARASQILRDTIREGTTAGAIIHTVAASCMMARLQANRGLLHEAYDTYQAAAQLIPEADEGHRDAEALVKAGMADVLYEWNELDAALAHLQRGLALLPLWGKADDLVLGYVTLARIHRARVRRRDALQAVEEAARLVETGGVFLEARQAVAVARVELWLDQGDLQAASRWIAAREARLRAGDVSASESELMRIACARVLIAQDKPREAVDLLSRAEETARSAGRMGRVIETLVLQALALQAMGDADRALLALAECLALAAPEGHVRVFVDAGQPMRVLLARWLARGGAGPLQDYAARLLSHFDAEPAAAGQGAAAPAADLVEPLSPRELEVLHLVALGRTNREIARQLVVATGTVKAHTSSIYRKLDVANRTEAVARARQLGLLP